jgi:hypothetical protein
MQMSECSDSDRFIPGVGIRTGYGLDGRGAGVRAPVRATFFSSPRCQERFCIHQASYPIGIGGSFPGDKVQGCEAGHSPPSPGVKNTWIFTSTPPYVFIEYCLIN